MCLQNKLPTANLLLEILRQCNERGITPPACGSNGYCLLSRLIREAPSNSSDDHIRKVQSQAAQQSNWALKPHPSAEYQYKCLFIPIVDGMRRKS